MSKSYRLINRELQLSMQNTEVPINSQAEVRKQRRVSGLLFALLFAFLSLMFHATVEAQEKPTRRGHGYITELRIREWATAIVMPSFPEGLLEDKSRVVIKAKIEITAEGNVIRAAVQPGQYPLIREAVFKAVKQWTFKPTVTSYAFPDSTWISRLTFVYVMENGEGRVEMYTPPREAAPFDRLDGMYPPTELKEWQEWVDADHH
jgi:hypothetical protein